MQKVIISNHRPEFSEMCESKVSELGIHFNVLKAVSNLSITQYLSIFILQENIEIDIL